VEARRRELHLRVGEALLELHRDSPAEVHGLLARHFAEADEPKRAVEYLVRAGDAARAVYAHEEAIELYRRALGFMERTGDEALSRETLLKIGLTHHVAFDYRAANEAFGEAFARAAPKPLRMEPTEHIVWAVPAAHVDRVDAPGHSTSVPAAEVTRNLFRGLVAIGRDFEIEPDLAEGFTVSDDGRSYRFTLRHDALWSDGAPVTANDFAFTFAQMAEDELVSASWLDGVRARALDERRLEIRLREPRNHFLYQLAHPLLFAWPRHVYVRDGRDWHQDDPLVGNGPFLLKGRDENRVVIAAAPNWHGASGNVGEVTIELEASWAVVRERWRNGEYDVVHDAFARRVGADETLVQQAPGMFTWYLGFDASRAPVDTAHIRRALAHSIDRNRPAQAFGSAAATMGGLLSPTMPGHSHRVAPAFDPDRARALLSEAGYTAGRALEIVLGCLPLWEDAASEVAAQLGTVGVRARLLIAASDRDLQAAIDEKRAHAYIWGYAADYPDPGGVFLGVLRGSPLYLDDQLEQLLTRASSLRDQDERLRTYREFERIWIGDKAAVVPIAYMDRIFWRRPWVTEMWANALAQSTFANAVVKRA
ncbi:MAG: ABC transporter substrate-binding protein, partial [Candidatus Rokuibacteriota bacterium]